MHIKARQKALSTGIGIFILAAALIHPLPLVFDAAEERQTHKYFDSQDVVNVLFGWNSYLSVRAAPVPLESIRPTGGLSRQIRWNVRELLVFICVFRVGALGVIAFFLQRYYGNYSKQLEQSEQRFKTFLDSTTDYAIFNMDRDGCVADWNSGSERLYGYTKEEIIGQNISVFYPPEWLAMHSPQANLRVVEQHGRFDEQGDRIKKDGTVFLAECTITAIRDSQNKIAGFWKVTRNVTERQRAADALALAAQRAEDANRAKSEFLTSMSHEIRTPMNAILGMTELLQASELTGTQREYVDRCRRAGTNLLSLINDILDLSKIESGKFELEQVPLDIKDLLQKTVDLMQPRAQLKNIRLVTEDRLPDLFVVGDPVRLQQIWINLIGNAIKFTEEGSVTVSASAHPDQVPGHLVFEVTDTGIGIEASKLEMIFEDFTQAEKWTTRRFGGTGLGLGIAKRLVTRMGGEIHVASVVGKGSTFSFSVQLKVNGRPEEQDQFANSADLEGKRVLIVDNNPTNRLILSRMCAGWNMITAEAESAADARILLHKSEADGYPFAVVLLDVIMPEVNGFEALAQMRFSMPKLPVILTSSTDHPGDTALAKKLGAAALLYLPIQKELLLETMCAAIDAAKESATKEASQSRSRPRILIAEDSDDNRFLLEAYLKDEPYDLIFVENGQEAVNAFVTSAFDLVLMDVQMPVMDGLKAARTIRDFEKRYAGTRTPMLALTANALMDDVEKSHKAGCDGHLSKPVSKKNLLSVMEQWLAAEKKPV